MNKKNCAILLGALLALISCSNDDTMTKEFTSETSQPIIFELTANHPDDATATRAVKTTWETNDVVFVFFSGGAAPQYLEMKWNGAEWINTAKNGLTLTEGSSGTMRAVYLPFGNDATISASSTDFVFNKTDNTYYLTAAMAYTVTSGKVSGAFNMQIPEGYVQFFLDDASASSSTDIELREPNLTPQGITSIASDGTITHNTIANGAPLKGYVYDKETKASGESKGYLFSGILAASARNTSKDYHFTVVSGGWKGDYYSKSFTDKTLYTATNAGRAVKLPALSGWTAITDYKPIDMGCDVSGKRIYWASRNLGASKDLPASATIDEFHYIWGDYYAWGETAPYYTAGHAYDNPCTNWADGKTGYDWTTYKYETAGDGTAFTKYTTDGDVLEATDDAAHAVLGGPWRMPTEAEFTALTNTSNYDWSDWNGTYCGRVVTVKGGTAWTDPTILIPGAGYRGDGDLTTIWGIYGEPIGRYWTSSLSSMHSCGRWMLYKAGGDVEFSSQSRFFGCSVRPVSE